VNYVLLGFSISAVIIGQILFKMTAMRGTFGVQIIHDLTGLLLFGSALILYAASTVAWVMVLRTTPLSVAYPVLSLAFALMPFLSYMVFREPLTASLIVGNVLILAGIYVIVRGSGTLT
jgi:multidrug transporter EmrE-like cation transporter